MYKSQAPAAATAAVAPRPQCRAAAVLAAAVMLLAFMRAEAASTTIQYNGGDYGACVPAGRRAALRTRGDPTPSNTEQHRATPSNTQLRHIPRGLALPLSCKLRAPH